MKIGSCEKCSNPTFTSSINQNQFMKISEFGARVAYTSQNPEIRKFGENYNKALEFFKNDGKKDVISFDFTKSHLPTAVGYEVSVNNVIKRGGHLLNGVKLLGVQCCKAVVSFAQDCGMKM